MFKKVIYSLIWTTLLLLLVCCNSAFAAEYDCRQDEDFFAADERDWEYIEGVVDNVYDNADKYRADFAFVSGGEAYTEAKDSVTVDTRFFNYRYNIRTAPMYIGIYSYEYRDSNVTEITMRYYSDSDDIVPEFVKADDTVVKSSDIAGASFKKYDNGLKELTLKLDKKTLAELAFLSRENNRVEVLSPVSTKSNLTVSSVSINLEKGDYGVMRVLDDEERILVADAEIKNHVSSGSPVVYSNTNNTFAITAADTDDVSIIDCCSDWIVTTRGRSIDTMDFESMTSIADNGNATADSYIDDETSTPSELTQDDEDEDVEGAGAIADDTADETGAGEGTGLEVDSEVDSEAHSETDEETGLSAEEEERLLELETDIEERSYLGLTEGGAYAMYSDSYIFAENNSPYVYSLIPSELGTEFFGNIFAMQGILSPQEMVFTDPLEMLGCNSGDIDFAPNSMKIRVANNYASDYAGELSFVSGSSSAEGENADVQFCKADGSGYISGDAVVGLTEAFLKKASYCAVDADDIICAVYNQHGRLLGMADGYTEEDIAGFLLIPTAGENGDGTVAEVSVKYNDVLAENGTYAALDYISKDGEYASFATSMSGYANYEDEVQVELALNYNELIFSYAADEENMDIVFDGFGEYDLRSIGKEDLENEADKNAAEELLTSEEQEEEATGENLGGVLESGEDGEITEGTNTVTDGTGVADTSESTDKTGTQPENTETGETVSESGSDTDTGVIEGGDDTGTVTSDGHEPQESVGNISEGLTTTQQEMAQPDVTVTDGRETGNAGTANAQSPPAAATDPGGGTQCNGISSGPPITESPQQTVTTVTDTGPPELKAVDNHN